MGSRIVTLTTDFGVIDPFVGIMKGVMLSINPALQCVDLSHQIEPHDILGGALVIHASYSYFPPQTIHLVVVDPGVGSERRPILAICGDYFFLAPDNGVLSTIYEESSPTRVIALSVARYFRREISRTFHGRDIFAPVAAWLSKGVAPLDFGQEIRDYTRFHLPKPDSSGGEIQGEVLYVDRFGNLTTNISGSFLKEGGSLKVEIKSIIIDRLCQFYGEKKEGEIGAIINSWGYLEIFRYGGSAQRFLDARRGDEVRLSFV
ncbi:MAG: SAM-dependent chlorinase/fluorinase [Candidatus Tectomicrobia bacterium]|nr:SAM-dependent chlorinase/fluorinase [Candidatus Tectomicrobia bacterium]